MPAGRVPCRSQVWPKFDVAADQSAVPSLATTMQSAAVVHFTEVTAMDPAGVTDGAQLFPPLCVVSTTPVPGFAPVDPTAMHTLAPGHETPVRAGGAVPALNGWVVQVRPPLTVAAITVVPLTGVAVVAAGRRGGRRGRVGARHPHRPAVLGVGAGHRAQLARAGRRGLSHRNRGS